MGLLDQEYAGEGSDAVGGNAPTAKVLDLTVSNVEEKTSRQGSAYISVDYAYKDDSNEWRYIRFNNFNPAKSEGGKQLWLNLLKVCGTTKGTELKGKKFKAVCIPTEYAKNDGNIGTSMKVFKNSVFDMNGVSPGGDKEKMLNNLQEAIEIGVDRLQQSAPATAPSTPETASDLPF